MQIKKENSVHSKAEEVKSFDSFSGKMFQVPAPKEVKAPKVTESPGLIESSMFVNALASQQKEIIEETPVNFKKSNPSAVNSVSPNNVVISAIKPLQKKQFQKIMDGNQKQSVH